MPHVLDEVSKQDITQFLRHNRYLFQQGLAAEIDYVGVNDKNEIIWIYYKKEDV